MARGTMPGVEPPPHTDGRERIGARNRERIVNALLDLVRAGELQPTAEQVARHAKVGTRTVFRHFDDMETLTAELAARVEREIRPLLAKPPVDGTPRARVRELVRRRANLYERIAPFKRSGNLRRPRSEFLQRSHADLNRRLRAELTEALASELDGPSNEQLEALDLVMSFEAWDRLRLDQQLGRKRAVEVIESATLAVLAAGTADRGER